MTGEKSKGRKCHIVAGAMGNLPAVVVHATNRHDTKSGILAAREDAGTCRSIQRFCADAGQRRTFVREVGEELSLGAGISKKIRPHTWEKLPMRRVVERTFGWFNNARRLSKDYEITVASAVAMVQLSHVHTLLKRL